MKIVESEGMPLYQSMHGGWVVQALRKWAYRVVDLIMETKAERETTKDTSGGWVRASDLETVLNKLGAQGWELVGIHFILDRGEAVVVGFFKRLL